MNTCYSKFLNKIDFLDCSKDIKKTSYDCQDILSLAKFEEAKKEITSWNGYQQTPLIALESLASSTNTAGIYYKDESHRFSLKSFKALGGAYAVAKLLIDHLRKMGMKASSSDLISGNYRDITKNITVACATDGNHGRSVAWGALIFGCRCEIFIHEHVSQGRAEAIQNYGANVNRVKGNYDASVHEAACIAKERGFFIVSDTSYEGYTSVPKDVMQGYTIMVYEALQQIKTKPTHIFLQGGVGGMAAAVVSFILETYDKEPPIMIIVEPEQADCLLQTAKNREPTVVHGDLETIMAGLSCGEVSILAWEILKDRISAYISISDDPVISVMKDLSQLGIIAGESAVAGVAGFNIIQHDQKYRDRFNINEESHILFFGTEGDTDSDIYEKIVGKSAAEVSMIKHD